MKIKQALFFVFILLTNIALAQTYVGENVVLSSQSEVNVFGSNNYEEIQSSLQIYGDDITDLTPLENLKIITGSLFIESNPELETLNGLENITAITSGLSISKNTMLKSLAGLEQLSALSSSLIIEENPEITNLTGLITNFENIDPNIGVSINSNQNLIDISHLGNFEDLFALNIHDNHKLTSLQGLESVKSLNQINISYNSSLADCSTICTLVSQNKINIPPVFINNYGDCFSDDQFQNSCSNSTDNIILTSQTEVDNFKETYGNSTILNGFLLITRNLEGINPITNLNGLNHLQNIRGEFVVNQNPELTTLNDLNDELKIEKGIVISENDQLENLEALEDITNENLNRLAIGQNKNLINITPPKRLKTITGDLSFYSNPKMIFNGAFDFLTLVTERVTLSSTGNFKDLSFLPNLNSINQSLYIDNNIGLTSLSGLENLNSIGDGLLIISENVNLKNITALKNATIDSSIIRVSDNNALTSLDGLDGVKIASDIIITRNKSLIDFVGLNQLENFYGIFVIGTNESLKSLKGLEKLGVNSNQISSNLIIDNNNNLTNFCAIQNFFSNNPAIISAFIYDNAYNPTRVQILDSETCSNQNLSTIAIQLKSDLTLYPNPVIDNLFISSTSNTKINNIEIFDINGQRIDSVNSSTSTIDLSNAPSGMYFIKLESSAGKIMKKIMVQ